MYANNQQLYMKKLTLIISCLLITFQSFAQLPNAKTTGRVTIKGTVIDFDTKEPLEYATIVVKLIMQTILVGLHVLTQQLPYQVK